jgi:hypothetical protein
MRLRPQRCSTDVNSSKSKCGCFLEHLARKNVVGIPVLSVRQHLCLAEVGGDHLELFLLLGQADRGWVREGEKSDQSANQRSVIDRDESSACWSVRV